MAYNPQNPNGQTGMANSAPVVIASDQSAFPVNVSQVDAFSQIVTASRYNQVEIAFDQVAPASITDITVTTANGGTSSNSNGQALFSSGSNTNGGIKAVTNNTVSYRPHSEVYAAFTSIFTAGIANSYQRIGPYDLNNGFFIGYSGTSFGATIRKAGADTFIPQSSFNIDGLTGAPNSKYTRNGVPEALDTGKDNLYRIRFGWLGAAPIQYEVLSPDGQWVLYHIIRHPNSTTGTTINNPDLPITLDIQKTTAGASVLTMNTACWAIGTSSDLSKVGSTITDNTLVKPTRSILTAKMPSGAYTNIDATAGGNLKVSIEEIDGAAIMPITGTVGVTGTVSISGTPTVSVTGTASVTGTVSISGTPTVSGVVGVTGVVGITGTASVTGTVGITGTPTVSLTGTVTAFHLVSTGTTNPTNIKSSAGRVMGWYIYNSNGSMRKVAFHDTAGTPTAGSNVSFALPIPALSAANVYLTEGVGFTAGIAITTVTGITAGATGSVSADDLAITIFYK